MISEKPRALNLKFCLEVECWGKKEKFTLYYLPLTYISYIKLQLNGQMTNSKNKGQSSEKQK